MGAKQETVYHGYESPVPEKPQRPKVSGFTTPWLRGDLGFFCVHLSVIGPVSQEPESNLALTSGEAELMLQEISYLIEALVEHTRSKDA